MIKETAADAAVAVGPDSCSARSLGKAMIGTCDHVDGWLLVEAAGAWDAKGANSPALPPTLAPQVLELLRLCREHHGLKLRPQLVKQARTQGQRVLLVIKDRLWSLAGGHDALANLSAEQLAELFAAAVSGEAGEQASSQVTAAEHPGAAVQAIVEPQYFVCTHGQRDRCCGVLGMPLYRSLMERVQQRAWQISHLGGHRFAPNVLVLPGALLYGRVFPEQVEHFVRTVEDGGIDFERLRGRSIYPPVVQAAEALVTEPGLRLLHVEEQAAGAVRVVFAGAAQTHELDVVRLPEEEHILASCGASELKPYSPFAARS